MSDSGSCCSHNNHGSVAADGRKDLLAPSADQLAECPVMVGSAVVKADAEAAGLPRLRGHPLLLLLRCLRTPVRR